MGQHRIYMPSGITCSRMRHLLVANLRPASAELGLSRATSHAHADAGITVLPIMHVLSVCRWQHIRDSDDWKHGSFYGLAFAYSILAVVALVQLVRIERRVPEYGWTTQKVFHLLNLLVCSLRAGVMTFRSQLMVRCCSATPRRIKIVRWLSACNVFKPTENA